MALLLIFSVWNAITVVCVIVGYYVSWVIYSRTLHPLAKVPGPVWPAVSRTWLMYRMYQGDLETHMRAIHNRFVLCCCEHWKYGSIVRTTPDEVHVSDPKAIPIIYPTQQPLKKTDWYLIYRPVTLGPGPDLFTDDDAKHHAAHRRIVGSVYTLSSMLKNERALDDLVKLFGDKLGGLADCQDAFDFGLWPEMFSFDGVGAVFFGSPFGFLETSSDYGNYIAAVHTAMPLNSVVAMAPLWIRRYLLQVGVMIPKVLKAIIATDGIRQTAVRKTGVAQERTSNANANRTDVLSQLLSIMREKNDCLTIKEIHVEMWAAVIAGSDSTSGALHGTITHPVQYNQATKIPYLRAVIQESLRLCPPFALLGHHIPTAFKAKVGMNAMVTQFDETVFGKDAREFRPERWLESEERFRLMEKSMLVFGAGTRTCIGRHLSNAEMYKLIPHILRHFTVEMAHDGPWKTHNATFLLQSNVICKVKRRSVENRPL
ncbi:cytochrome P450 [Alternaria alternata]|uniref:Cytochrome P450 n=1 Tax=Alternaria alternata TaxID=5599 RepID=A0A177E192_ALTAL|nr:cytochrome P450 [Alternaria alternata]OAG25518.1 cytochrome P450 [Alternaria alternata]